jgi:hypothetical protein
MPDVHCTVTIPLSSFRAYETAARILRRKLGAGGPDAAALIRHELSHRVAQMIADEYQESQRQSFGRRELKSTRSGREVIKSMPNRRRLGPPSGDPSLN